MGNLINIIYISFTNNIYLVVVCGMRKVVQIFKYVFSSFIRCVFISWIKNNKRFYKWSIIMLIRIFILVMVTIKNWSTDPIFGSLLLNSHHSLILLVILICTHIIFMLFEHRLITVALMYLTKTFCLVCTCSHVI